MNREQDKQTIDRKALSDVELIRLSSQQPALFEEIVNRYQRAFVRKASSILGSQEEAHDVVQETFVRIYVSARKFQPQPGASFSSWAYTILVNQCYTAYRKKQRASTVSFDLALAGAGAGTGGSDDSGIDFAEIIPDQAGVMALEQRLTADYVTRMLSRLPLLLRRAVEQHFIDGLPQKEIAEREGVSHGVIRQRIHRAKAELRKLDLKFAYAAPASSSLESTK